MMIYIRALFDHFDRLPRAKPLIPLLIKLKILEKVLQRYLLASVPKLTRLQDDLTLRSRLEGFGEP